METDDESSRQRTVEIEKDIGPAVLRHITPLNNALFLQLLMRKFIWSQSLRLLLASALALALAPNIVQIRLVSL